MFEGLSTLFDHVPHGIFDKLGFEFFWGRWDFSICSSFGNGVVYGYITHTGDRSNSFT